MGKSVEKLPLHAVHGRDRGTLSVLYGLFLLERQFRRGTEITVVGCQNVVRAIFPLCRG